MRSAVKHGPFANKVGIQPKPGRLIRCAGHDWSPFTCEGEIRMIKRGKKVVPTFFLKRPMGFISDRETWKDIETWEYVEAKTDSVSKGESL